VICTSSNRSEQKFYLKNIHKMSKGLNSLNEYRGLECEVCLYGDILTVDIVSKSNGYRVKSNNGSKHKVNKRDLVINKNKAEEMFSCVLNPNNEFFDMLINHWTTYDCSNCLGFLCGGCWRGCIVVIAHMSEDFYRYLSNKDTRTSKDILDAVSIYNRVIKESDI